MQRVLKKVYESKKLSIFLKIISHASTLYSAFAFLEMLTLLYRESLLAAIKVAVFAAVPFVIVTLVRRLINAPRPYEIYPFYKKKPKGKGGRSFPSRHVFSAFVIAVLGYTVCPVPVVIALMLPGVLLAVSRVLLGIHFIRDVLAGALIGIASGVIGVLLFML